MAPNPNNPGNMGVGGLQQVVDQLAHVVGQLANMTQSNSQGMTTAAKAISVASSAWSGGSISWSPGSNWSQGKPNGGGGGFTQTRQGGLMAAGRLGTLAMNPNRGGAGGGGMSQLPNGGGSSGGGGGLGISMGFPGIKDTIQGGYNNAVNFGNQHMSSQMMMDTYASWASNNFMNGGTSANRSQLLYNAIGNGGQNVNRMALSTQDAIGGEMARLRMTGTASVSNPTGRATYGNMGVLGMSNPTLGMTGAASIQQNMLSAGTYWRAQQMGLGAIRGQGGTPISITDLSSRLMQRGFAGGKFSSTDLAGSLGEGGYMRQTLNMLYGGDQRAVDAMSNEMRLQKTAQDHGMSGSQFGTLMNQAGRTGSQSQAAIARLKAAGVDTKSMLQSQKTLEGTKRAMEGDYNEQFAASMEKATGYVDQFNKLMDKIVQNPLVKKILGGTGGMSALNSGMSDAKSMLGMLNPVAALGSLFMGGGMGNLGNMLNGFPGIGNEAGGPGGIGLGVGGRLAPPGTGGGAASGMGSAGGNAVNSTGGTSGGPTASSVIQFLEKNALGKPYVYGATGPNAFDCSGMVQWGMKHFGVDPGRTTYAQYAHGATIPLNQVQPGDVVFAPGSDGSLNNPGHEAMYIGGGQIIEAAHKGTNVRIRSFIQSQWPSGARRFLGSVGNMNFGGGQPGNTSTTQGSTTTGGNLGSSLGSTEEIDAIMSALSGGPGGARTYGDGTSSGGSGGTQGSQIGNVNVAGGGTTAASARAMAKAMMPAWANGSEWAAWDALMMQESGWNHLAMNHQSGAFGIAQALGHGNPGTGGKYGNQYPNKAANNGDAGAQIKWEIGYIQGRYKDPLGAMAHERAYNWYDKGSWEIAQDENARIHKGEMVIPAKQANTIRDALLKESVYGSTPNKQSGSGKSSGSGGVTLTFNQGSIVIQVQGAMTEDSARRAATAFTQQLAKENIYNQIAAGVN
jgi:hypothetical protein